MDAGEAQLLEVGGSSNRPGSRRQIAYLKQPGGEPGLIWLPGFHSEMVSVKATAVSVWAATQVLALLRFDYSGHGRSPGRVEDGTIGQWAEEARCAFERLTEGPQVLVGSSMGGYLALLLLRRLMVEHPAAAARISALVLIAPAWDMTEELIWKTLPDGVKQQVMTAGIWSRPSQYGDPYPITRSLIEEGRRHLFAGRPWNPGRPVRIIHGRRDVDVPFTHSERLMAMLDGDWVRLIDVADAEHRLSRPEDLAVMLSQIDDVRG